MFKWLVILVVGLYAAFLIGGQDRGQLRAGLRDAPQDPQQQLQTVVVEAAPVIAGMASDDDLAPAPVIAAVATDLVPLLPRQPVRILPRPDEPTEMTFAKAETAADPAPAAQTDDEAPAGTDLRWVNVDRANVRAAGSRSAAVTGRIERGEAVLVLWTEPSGWVRIRVEGDGADGFVHESLLSSLDPQLQ